LKSNKVKDKTLGKSEAKQHLIYIKKALQSTSVADRQQALVEGFMFFGQRFIFVLNHFAEMANGEGPFFELKNDAINTSLSWLSGVCFTDRVDEVERRAEFARSFIEEGKTGLYRLAAICILELPEGHPQRDVAFARQALLERLAQVVKERDVEGQLSVIETILNYYLEPLDRSLELIQQGEVVLEQVADAMVRRNFWTGVFGYFVNLSFGRTDERQQWVMKAETVLSLMREEDPKFFTTPQGKSLCGLLDDRRGNAAEAATNFAAAVDSSDPESISYQQAALIDARYGMDDGKYERVVKILSPVVNAFEDKYLMAVEESAIKEAGEIFSEAVWNLAFAYAHLGQWNDAIRYLERGRSKRLRYEAALRRSTAGKRLLELQVKLYSLTRGVRVEAKEFNKKRTEDWIGEKISLKTKILEEYRRQRLNLSDEMMTTPSIREIAAVLAQDEAVVILGITNPGGTLIAVICSDDTELPSGQLIDKDWTLARWLPLFAGDNQDGWIFALGAPELNLDHRKSLSHLLSGMEEFFEQKLTPLLKRKTIRRLTIIPHHWFHLLPFWALPCLERYEIAVASSAAYFIQSRNKVGAINRKALVVSNPTDNLPGSTAEGESVTQHLTGIGFDVRHLEKNAATEDKMVNALSGVSVFHFCGHGRSDMDYPTRSALFVYPDLSDFPNADKDPFAQIIERVQEWRELPENERSAEIDGLGRLFEKTKPLNQTMERRLEHGESKTLWGRYKDGVLTHRAELWTAGDILIQNSLNDCRLAFLSACEAGRGSLKYSIDEYSGLPAALQLAGVSAVICSLWTVSDALAAFYVDLFYQSFAKQKGVADLAAILRQVSLRLRRMKKDEAVSLLTELRQRTSYPRARFLLEAYTAKIKNGGSLPFKHPFDWASFYVSGTVNLLLSEEGET